MKTKTRALTNEELVQKFQSGDESVFEDLLHQNRGLLFKFARHYAKNEEDVEDLLQVGRIALHRAAHKFDFSIGTKFVTLAYWCVKNDTSRWYKTEMYQHGRLKTVPIHSRVGWRISLGDTLPGRDETENPVIDHEFCEVTRERIKLLPERTRKIVLERFEGRTFSDMGRELKITKERVRQLYERGIKEVRADMVQKPPELPACCRR